MNTYLFMFVYFLLFLAVKKLLKVFYREEFDQWSIRKKLMFISLVLCLAFLSYDLTQGRLLIDLFSLEENSILAIFSIIMLFLYAYIITKDHGEKKY